MSSQGFRSGVSATYWVMTGIVLVGGGVFIAVKINIAGLVLAALGLLAFWLARRSRTVL
jgi:hypothetical protein